MTDYATECSEAELLEDIDGLTSFSEYHKPREAKLVPNTYGRGGKIPPRHEIRLPKKFTEYRNYNDSKKGKGRGRCMKTPSMEHSFYPEASDKDPFTLNKSIEAECQKDMLSKAHYLYGPLTSHSVLPPAVPRVSRDQKSSNAIDKAIIKNPKGSSNSSSTNECHIKLVTDDCQNQNSLKEIKSGSSEILQISEKEHEQLTEPTQIIGKENLKDKKKVYTRSENSSSSDTRQMSDDDIKQKIGINEVKNICSGKLSEEIEEKQQLIESAIETTCCTSLAESSNSIQEIKKDDISSKKYDCDEKTQEIVTNQFNDDCEKEDNNQQAINCARTILNSTNQPELTVNESSSFFYENCENNGSYSNPDLFILNQEQENYPYFSDSADFIGQHLLTNNNYPLTEASYNCSEFFDEGFKPDKQKYSTWSTEVTKDFCEYLPNMNYDNAQMDECAIHYAEDNEDLEYFTSESDEEYCAYDSSQINKFLTEISTEFKFKTEEFPSLKELNRNTNEKVSRKRTGKINSLSLKSLAESLATEKENKDDLNVNGGTANGSSSVNKKKLTNGCVSKSYIDIKNFSCDTSKDAVYDYIMAFGRIQHLEMIPDVNSLTARVWMEDPDIADWIKSCLNDQHSPLGDNRRILEVVSNTSKLNS